MQACDLWHQFGFVIPNALQAMDLRIATLLERNRIDVCFMYGCKFEFAISAGSSGIIDATFTS